MTELPTGTVTFLYTDIEGSTALWERQPQAMPLAVERHLALLSQAIAAQHGRVFRTVGDGLCAAFATAAGALAAALAAQQALVAEPWGEIGPLRVRMALHTGAVEVRDGDYVGACLNRIARLLAVGHGGQVLLSLATEELVRDTLPSGAGLHDLGEHRLRDLVRPEHVYQLLHPELPADFPPLHSLDAFPHNLPLQLTSFIGREAELAEIKRLLATTRLLTLTGTGGCGKTRLALQAAGEVVQQYPNGVWLVELAALADPALVPQTVATTVGVREQPGQPIMTTVAASLKAQRLLLVLDNCEHLIDGCARLADALLRACPAVRLLATSREPIGIAGELTWRVPSLALPDRQHLPPPAELSQVEAVQLFVERAAFAHPGFTVTRQNAAAVAQLCWRLDGIPLALELAAARVTVLPVEQLVARLEDRFRVLTRGSRATPRRQQTLAAMVEWSYNLLTEPERQMFYRLAVFAGGWTLEAAEAVCVDAGGEAADIFELLARLVDKSLVVADEGETGTARYRLLETLRQYGQQRLAGSGEEEELRQRHRDYFLALAERAEPELRRAQQSTWLVRLERDYENLRTAIRWSLDSGDFGQGLRLANALWRFWEVRGLWTEGRTILAEVLAQRQAGVARPSVPLRARALQGAGALAFYQGDYAASRALLDESLTLFRELEDRPGIAWSLLYLAWGVNDGGDPAGARPLLEESLARARRSLRAWASRGRWATAGAQPGRSTCWP